MPSTSFETRPLCCFSRVCAKLAGPWASGILLSLPPIFLWEWIKLCKILSYKIIDTYLAQSDLVLVYFFLFLAHFPSLSWVCNCDPEAMRVFGGLHFSWLLPPFCPLSWDVPGVWVTKIEPWEWPLCWSCSSGRHVSTQWGMIEGNWTVAISDRTYAPSLHPRDKPWGMGIAEAIQEVPRGALPITCFVGGPQVDWKHF